MKRPQVSVIINSYNYGQFIEDAVSSVIKQTLDISDVEIIVVDDGSTDDTALRLQKYGDSIIYLHKTNGGQASALNHGFAHSSGDIIAFLDSDDYWDPAKLETSVGYFSKHADLDIFYHNLLMVNRSGDIGGPLKTEWQPSDTPYSFDVDASYLAGRIPSMSATSAMVFKRECLQNIMPMPESYRILADCYLHFFGLCFSRKILIDGTSYGYYRLHDSNNHSNENPGCSSRQLTTLFENMSRDMICLGKEKRRDVSGIVCYFQSAADDNRNRSSAVISIGWSVKTWRRIKSVMRRQIVKFELMGCTAPFFISVYTDMAGIIMHRFDNLFKPIKNMILNILQNKRNSRIIAKTAQKSDMIIGAAVGYSTEHIKPFILSLRATGYKGRLLLLIDKLDFRTVSFLREYDVELIWQGGCRNSTMPVHSQRYFNFSEILRKERGIKRVMLSDVRDVIFQGNPFDNCGGDSLYTFGEDNSMKLGQCPYNSGWILNLYGDEILKRLSDGIIICCGVTIGGYSKMLNYLDLLCGEISVIPLIHGADQGAHNLLIRTGRIPNVVVTDNEAGPVYTLHYVHPDRIRTDSDGFIINDAGRPAVVHQYDRHPALMKIVQEKYI